MGFPLTLILSLNETMWGEVNKPVLRPLWRRIDSDMAQVEPLPFVPATWITPKLFRSSKDSPAWKKKPTDLKYFSTLLSSQLLCKKEPNWILLWITPHSNQNILTSLFSSSGLLGCKFCIAMMTSEKSLCFRVEFNVAWAPDSNRYERLARQQPRNATPKLSSRIFDIFWTRNIVYHDILMGQWRQWYPTTVQKLTSLYV